MWNSPISPLSRRSALYGLGASLGSVAFSSLLQADETSQQDAAPLAPKSPMISARAKNVIMLFMEGGPGHMDTFDPKPELTRLHKTESKLTGTLEKGFKFFVGSPFKFRKVGQSGIEMCDQWQHLADPFVADELCNFRGCQAESLNHPEALFHMNTGSRLGGDPAVGAWATYGLGTDQPEPSRLRRHDRTWHCRRAGRPTGATDSCRLISREHAFTSDRLANPRSRFSGIQITRTSTSHTR